MKQERTNVRRGGGLEKRSYYFQFGGLLRSSHPLKRGGLNPTIKRPPHPAPRAIQEFGSSIQSNINKSVRSQKSFAIDCGIHLRMWLMVAGERSIYYI